MNKKLEFFLILGVMIALGLCFPKAQVEMMRIGGNKKSAGPSWYGMQPPADQRHRWEAKTPLTQTEEEEKARVYYMIPCH